MIDFTRVPNDLVDLRATVPLPGFWRPRISSVVPRWMPARMHGLPCPWSCHPYWGHHSARPPRCHPWYFRSRLGCLCRAAHCSLWKDRREKYKKRAFVQIQYLADTQQPEKWNPASSCYFLSLACRVAGEMCVTFAERIYTSISAAIVPAASSSHGFVLPCSWIIKDYQGIIMFGTCYSN